jgi:LPXTG-motif cell wall-anchored protein
MLRPRHVLTCALVLALLVLALPVAAIAAGGGSAGDQQYVDPLAHTPTAQHSPASSSTSGASSSPTWSSTPAATPASTVTLTSNDDVTKTSDQLPHTGYNDSLAAGLGFVLLVGGIGLRRRTRRA